MPSSTRLQVHAAPREQHAVGWHSRHASELRRAAHPRPLLPPSRSYAVLVDGVEKKAGSLFEDFSPAINPPETIPDPEDKKPADWVDEPR